MNSIKNIDITKTKISEITRIVAHKIHAKTSKRTAYVEAREILLEFAPSEKKTLIDRIYTALQNTTKTFQLDYEDKSESSVYSIIKNITTVNDKEFIKISSELADNLADAHFRTNIPGGYCLIGNGVMENNEQFFFIIKAELQEAFKIDRNELSLVKNIFLSPAKDFYKIGFFIKHENTFVPFMYDDQFSLQKKDLAEYFYGKFLGLMTHENDKLKTKNFFEEVKNFIEENVDNAKDRTGLLNALYTFYREDTSGLISPNEFSGKYLEDELKEKFDKEIARQYPTSFTKNLSLIENRMELERVTIPLSYSMKITGKLSELNNNIDIIDNINKENMENLLEQINSGRVKKIVSVKSK